MKMTLEISRRGSAVQIPIGPLTFTMVVHPDGSGAVGLQSDDDETVSISFEDFRAFRAIRDVIDSQAASAEAFILRRAGGIERTIGED